MDEPIDWPVLLRYLAGECTPVERASIVAWIGADAGRREYVESLTRIGETRSAATKEFDPRSSWPTMHGRMHAAEPGQVAAKGDRQVGGAIDAPTKTEKPGARPHPFFFRMRGEVGRLPHTRPQGVGGEGLITARRFLPLGVAFATGAGAALLVAVGVQGRWRMSRPSAHEYVTAAGQRETVKLSDGTRFTLAPGGTLRISRDYGVGDRAVSLDGEAYFSVVHDAQHPFVVRAANAVATDLGTTFDVRAYSVDSTVRIAVRDGRMSVCGRPTGRVLTASALVDCDHAELLAHDVASVDASGRLAVSRGVDVASVFAWTQGRLVFDDTPLRDVIRELDRAFDLEIAVADSALLGRRITGAFSDERVNDVLDAVTFAVGARYERAARRVVIRRAVTGAEHDRLNGPGAGMRIARAADPGK